MLKVIVTLASAVLALLPLGCAASRTARTGTIEAKAVMAPVNQFVDGFNEGDTKKALAACTNEMSIIDEFPPYEWHGAGASASWMTAYDADAKANGITEGVVTLGVPRHIDIQADRAYVVAPADYAFKKKGKSAKEKGSTFTFALRKEATGWRITGWSWSKS